MKWQRQCSRAKKARTEPMWKSPPLPARFASASSSARAQAACATSLDEITP
jgi:hypothetical protein